MPDRLLRAAGALLSPALGLRQCENLNRQASRCATMGEWALMILSLLDIEVVFGGCTLGAVVPAAGPMAVVGNHPFGILDSLVAVAALSPLRDDVRYLGQSHMQRVPQARAAVFPLQPTTGRPFQKSNAASLRRAVQWVRSGHALAHFPAPSVAHWNWSMLRVEEPAWSTLVGTLVRTSAACVVPMHFSGRNSLLFQTVGATCGSLRHALLLRELLNKRGSRITVTVGERLQRADFPARASAAAITATVREAVESLRDRDEFCREPVAFKR